MVQGGEVSKVCQVQDSVRLLFILRTGSIGLLDKKRCKVVIDESCVMCDSGAGEDVEHLLVCVRNLRGIGGCWLMR